MTFSARIQLVTLGSLSLLIYGAITRLSLHFVHGQGHRQRPILAFLALYASVFVLYVFALRLASRLPWRRRDLIIVLGFAFLFRFLLLFSNPIQEDDFYRYLWDGKVVASGLNPYGVAPAAVLEEQAEWRDYKRIADSEAPFVLILSRINHPWAPTIYPPLAQGVFGLAALAAPGSLLGLRLVFLVFDLGVCFLLIDLLRRLDMRGAGVLVYAWSPLVVKETINSAHYDVIPTFFLLLAVALSVRRKWLLAQATLALAILGKIYPILLAPLFVWRTALLFGRTKALCGVGVMGAVILAGYAPFLKAGTGLWQGAAVFAEEWQTNSFLFPFLHMVVTNRWMANLAVVAVLGGLLVALLRWRAMDDDRSFLWGNFVALGALFLLSPVGDPWYFLWLMPFLCVFPVRSWLLLSGLLGLYYLSFYFMYLKMADAFRWILWLEYPPFYALLLWEWRVRRKA